MRTLLIVAAATLAPAAALAQAPAATGNAVADAFIAAIDAGYDNVAVGSARDEGGATILTDVSATPTAGGSLSIGTVRIENGAAAAGGLTANTITYETIAESTPAPTPDASAQESTIATMVVTGVTLGGGTADAGPGLFAGEFATVALTDVAVSAGGAPFSFASANVAQTGSDGTARTLDFDLTDLTLVMADLEGAEELAAMGYDKLVIDIAADGSWDPAGTLDVKTVKIAGDDAGTLTLNLGADGVTEETLTQIGAAGGDFSTILGLTQAMNLKNLTLSYVDAGLADKMLDRQASQMGVDRAALVSQSVAAVDATMAQLNMPEFAATVSGALSAFLANPGTLTISAEPTAAVPLAQVIGGAMMAPQSLPTLLNLKISATQ